MRLTIRNSDGSVSQPTNITIESVFEKLAEYEDLEEAGRLVKMPCKIGDTIYATSSGIIVKGKTKRICIDEDGIDYIIINSDNHDSEITLRGFTFGKNLFLTREKAEAALKGAERGQNIDWSDTE